MSATGQIAVRLNQSRRRQLGSVPKITTIKGKKYYSIPAAAIVLGKPRMTVFRWVKRGGSNEVRIEAIRDPMNGSYFVSVESVKNLANRFRPVR